MLAARRSLLAFVLEVGSPMAPLESPPPTSTNVTASVLVPGRGTGSFFGTKNVPVSFAPRDAPGGQSHFRRPLRGWAKIGTVSVNGYDPGRDVLRIV
jgi:hypothetical protein